MYDANKTFNWLKGSAADDDYKMLMGMFAVLQKVEIQSGDSIENKNVFLDGEQCIILESGVDLLQKASNLVADEGQKSFEREVNKE